MRTTKKILEYTSSSLTILKSKIMEEVEKFYEWLEKMKSVHLADNYKMNKAYEIVYENSIDLKKPKKKCTQSI